MTELISKQKPVLVIGQGIAGTIISHILDDNDIAFYVIDDGHLSSSSLAAVGMYNPMVFKRLVKSWKADTVLPYAIDFYKNIENKMGSKFMFPTNNYRLLAQESEANDWDRKSALEEYENYLGDILSAEKVHTSIKAKLGYGLVKNTGRVDLNELLSRSRKHFGDKVINEKFDHKLLDTSGDALIYKGLEYSKIIFCEGYKVVNNPLFEDIKFKPVKGETMLINAPDLNLEEVIKAKIFIYPVGEDNYWIGSTYHWDVLDEIPSARAREQLVTKFEAIIQTPYTVIDHKAGVRPASKDRRPIIGRSRSFGNIFLFNGLGSKGVMLAPYFAKQLYQYIYYNKDISQIVNSQRFFS